MLMLGRKEGQGIYIGRGITITVVEVCRDGLIRIGVEAPKWVAVSRDDFTYEQHMRCVVMREHGKDPKTFDKCEGGK